MKGKFFENFPVGVQGELWIVMQIYCCIFHQVVEQQGSLKGMILFFFKLKEKNNNNKN